MSSISKDSSLVDFQDNLMTLLSSGASPTEVQERLLSDPCFEGYREYVSGFDLDMIAVACELMQKWAVRTKESRQNPEGEVT